MSKTELNRTEGWNSNFFKKNVAVFPHILRFRFGFRFGFWKGAGNGREGENQNNWEGGMAWMAWGIFAADQQLQGRENKEGGMAWMAWGIFAAEQQLQKSAAAMGQPGKRPPSKAMPRRSHRRQQLTV